ncbi:MAG: FKBP-type peptidyl-prolyl cis-trans isomerase [Bacteroidales bacterium]|nr:FKBP-type peptidyl-prolyl cis-trans isomerase [Bacteroidales bacterium]
MKTIKIIAVAAAAVACASCATSNGQSTESRAKALEKKGYTIEAVAPTQAEKDSISYILGLNFGYNIKMQEIGNDINFAILKKAMLDMINAEGDPQSEEFGQNFMVKPSEMQTAGNNFFAKKQAFAAEVATKEGEVYLEEVKAGANVKTTESGLAYEIISQGEGTIKVNDTLCVYYVGTEIDGKEFDSKKEESGEPFEFTLKAGYGGVIEGWVEGLQLVGKGGEINLYIPANLAYGDRGMMANKVLTFNVKVADVKPCAEAVEE